MANPRTTSQLMLSGVEWDALQDQVNALYILDNMTAQEVAARLSLQTNHRITERMLRSRLKKWGFAKNTRRPTLNRPPSGNIASSEPETSTDNPIDLTLPVRHGQADGEVEHTVLDDSSRGMKPRSLTGASLEIESVESTLSRPPRNVAQSCCEHCSCNIQSSSRIIVPARHNYAVSTSAIDPTTWGVGVVASSTDPVINEQDQKSRTSYAIPSASREVAANDFDEDGTMFGLPNGDALHRDLSWFEDLGLLSHGHTWTTSGVDGARGDVLGDWTHTLGGR